MTDNVAEDLADLFDVLLAGLSVFTLLVPAAGFLLTTAFFLLTTAFLLATVPPFGVLVDFVGCRRFSEELCRRLVVEANDCSTDTTFVFLLDAVAWIC